MLHYMLIIETKIAFSCQLQKLFFNDFCAWQLNRQSNRGNNGFATYNGNVSSIVMFIVCARYMPCSYPAPVLYLQAAFADGFHEDNALQLITWFVLICPSVGGIDARATTLFINGNLIY